MGEGDSGSRGVFRCPEERVGEALREEEGDVWDPFALVREELEGDVPFRNVTGGWRGEEREEGE